MTNTEREKRKETLQTCRELEFFNSAEARSTEAALMNECERPPLVDEWLKVVWYSEDCGGKMVRFKCGNPHLSKQKRETPINISDEATRLSNSISRTRRRIFELAACNTWDWFFTGTLDGEKCDRNDLNGTFKRLSQFVRDYRKKQTGERIMYLIVPERHKDGAWHFHGLIKGLPKAELYRFKLSDKIPKRVKDTIRGGTDVYTWKDYERRFGWATFTGVRSQNAVSKYVTKYITKDMCADSLDSNRHLYYASQGLNKPQVLGEGYNLTGYSPFCDYENDYIGVRSIEEKDEATAIMKQFLSNK